MLPLWHLIFVIATTTLIISTIYYTFMSSQTRRLIISTTTSLYDTGLLDEIEKKFEGLYPININFISLGTGQAIEYAKRGDADLILVHDPYREYRFLEDGYGICRKIVAYNFFVIVGPADDPVKIEGLSIEDALRKIVNAGRTGRILWVSRGDESGTHAKEKTLWTSAGFNWTLIREEGWYIESGTGMGKTLLFANEREAYTLADLGTYLKYYGDNRISLEIFISEEKELLNVYSVIAVNPKKISGVNFEDAILFIKFLISDECQILIGNFKKEIYGESLFHPAVQLLKENTDPTLVEWIRETAFLNGTECPQAYRGNHTELYE